MLAARYAARSDIGLSRRTNEDSWLARPPVFAVADGMGGARAGEVASRVAVETLTAGVADLDPRDRHGAGELLLSAAEEANRRVWELSTENASTAGMGTTLTALVLCSDAARLVHIGDSRAYALRDEMLTQLTDDHSLVAEMVRSGELAPEEIATHPLRSVLSRALGTEPDPTFDLLDVDLQAGDTILLCSDGLTGPVADDRIAALLAGPDPEEVAQSLVAEALESGGPDNITVLVIRLEEFTPAEKAAGEAAAAAAGAAAGLSAAAALNARGDADEGAQGPDAAGPEGSAPPEESFGSGGRDEADHSDRPSDTRVENGTDDHDQAAGTLRGEESSPSAAVGGEDDGAEARAQVGPASATTGGGGRGAAAALTVSTAAAAAGPASGATAPQSASPAPSVTGSEPTGSPSATTSDPAQAPPAAAAGGGTGADGSKQAPPARPRRRWRGKLIAVVAAVAVVAGGVLAAGQLEWVGVADDGVVAVYRGVPWEFAGMRLYREHDRSTTVRYEGLTRAQQQQVDAHAVGWRGSGEELLDELKAAP